MTNMQSEPRTSGGNIATGSSGEQFLFSTSSVMQALQRTVHDIAATEIPVLILGESGTGKGALAVRIHNLSRHHDELLTKLNCTSLAAKLGRFEVINGDGTNICF